MNENELVNFLLLLKLETFLIQYSSVVCVLADQYSDCVCAKIIFMHAVCSYTYVRTPQLILHADWLEPDVTQL